VPQVSVSEIFDVQETETCGLPDDLGGNLVVIRAYPVDLNIFRGKDRYFYQYQAIAERANFLRCVLARRAGLQ
jgi:hypothetical protein